MCATALQARFYRGFIRYKGAACSGCLRLTEVTEEATEDRRAGSTKSSEDKIIQGRRRYMWRMTADRGGSWREAAGSGG
jgi:hypothetical protein